MASKIELSGRWRHVANLRSVCIAFWSAADDVWGYAVAGWYLMRPTETQLMFSRIAIPTPSEKGVGAGKQTTARLVECALPSHFRAAMLYLTALSEQVDDASEPHSHTSHGVRTAFSSGLSCFPMFDGFSGAVALWELGVVTHLQVLWPPDTTL
jgi:hypothetical protein